MVQVDRRWGYLKSSKIGGWKALEDHPDISPAHEARMLWELLRETARLDECRTKGDGFLDHLRQGEEAGRQLEQALRAGDADAATRAYRQAKQSCNACHADYRN
jgi:hypothetical protein